MDLPAGGQMQQRKADLTVNGQVHTLSTIEDFVIPTGGEYLFTPSIAVLKKLAGLTV